jgi:cytoskeleton protein RodZ
VGATLRAAREAQGLTVADVAERIKFSVRQVEALEADDAAHLPEGTFLRGFIRSYARTLNLDESALLGGVPPAHTEPQADVAVAKSTGDAFPTTESARRKSVYLLLGALVVALVLASLVLNPRDSSQPERVVVEEVRLPDATAASAPVVAVPNVAAASAVPVVPAKPVEPAVTTAPPTKPKAVVPAPVAVPLVSGKPEVPLEQLKKRPIHIVFSDDAWMEITDVNGEVLLSRMNPAGSEKWIGGGRRSPYQVAIGKTSAVRIYYKGREVDLSQYKQTGLVHLVLE